MGDKYGKEDAANSVSPFPPFKRFTKNNTIGIGYKVNDNFMIRGEYSRIRGTSTLSNEFSKDSETKKNWDMVALQASYRFDIL